jgi:glutathione peroxidase
MNIYGLIVEDNKGKEVNLDVYKDKVLLIVNTATGCGLTPQYKGLQSLYEKYKDKGFEILDFPCNQFLSQAPGSDEEIATFCTTSYNTTFSRFKKINVNGDDASSLYKALKSAHPEDTENGETKGLLEKLKSMSLESFGTSIKWNFTKFLINKNGDVVKRFSPTCKPEELALEIEKYL